MSDMKHNLLHLLKIITAPIFCIMVVLEIVTIIFKDSLRFCGFKVNQNDSFWISVGDKWINLP